MFKQIVGAKVLEVFFANWGYFGKSGTPGYYIRGYVTTYDNGYKTVMGGGGASGNDVLYAYLLDWTDAIVETFDETL